MKGEVNLRRGLRERQTEAERKLWYVLRNRQLAGMKFRRQHTIDKYVVDFYCAEYNIAVEADGGQHYDIKNKERDEIRTRIINQSGIKVLRFSDTDILCKTDAVCESILAETVNAPLTRASRVLSPPKGREKK